MSSSSKPKPQLDALKASTALNGPKRPETLKLRRSDKLEAERHTGESRPEAGLEHQLALNKRLERAAKLWQKPLSDEAQNLSEERPRSGLHRPCTCTAPCPIAESKSRGFLLSF